MRKKIWLYSALLFCWAPNAWTAEPLTWTQCVQETLEHQPDLLSARAKLDQAQSNVISARSALFPQISASAGYRRSQAVGQEAADSYSYNLSGQLQLFDGFRTWNELSRAERQLQAVKLDYAQTSSTVRLQLRRAFVELSQTQAQIKLTQSIAGRRAQNVKLVKLRHAAGREHRGSLLLAQAQSAQAELDLKQAERNLSLAQYRLSQILGRAVFETLSVQDKLTEPVVADRSLPDYPALAKNTPLVLKSQVQKEAAQLAVNSAYGSFYPSLDANASIGRSDQIFPPEQEQWSMGVSLSWPLFSGGKRWAAVVSAEAQVRQVEAETLANYQTVYFNLMQAWIDFENALDQLEVEKKFLEAAQERSRISEAQYSTGLMTFDNWTIIEDNFVQTQKTYLSDQTQALEKEAAWIQVRGGMLEDEK